MSSFRLDEREQARQFAAYFKRLEDKLSALERTNQLNFASIEGGSLDIYDGDGVLKGSVGVQVDGTIALVPDPENTEPPPAPTAPTVEAALAGLVIGWSGKWADADAAPSDFALVQVHVGAAADFTPDASTQISQITDVTGGTATVHIEGYAPVWVRLVAVNTAALAGEPSIAVQGQPRQAVSQDLVDEIVTEVKVANDAITAAKIALQAVTSDKIAPGSVNELLLADDAVTAAKLAAGSVGALALADGSVLADKLAANSVTQGKVAASAITQLALADSAVTAAKVAVSAIDSTKIADAAVTAVKIGSAAVTAGKLAAEAVTAPAIAPDAVIAGKIAADAISSRELAANSVTAAELAAGSVTAAAIAAGTITAGQLAANSVTATQIAAGSVQTGALAADAVASGKVAADAITARELAANSVTASEISAGAVTAQAMAADSVTANAIKAGSVTTAAMVAGSIQGDRLAVGTVNADRIVSGSITTSQLNVTTAASIVQKFYDTGADAGKWRIGGTSTSTTAAPSNLTSVQVSDALAGGSVMRAVAGVTGAWRPDILIPYDPGVLYRVTAVVRQTVAGTDTAQQRVYLGVAGVAADGTTLVNSAGSASVSSQHYVAAAGSNLAAGSGWTRYTGYLKGYAAAGASGTSTAAPSPTSPGVLHANARYISPTVYANYQNGTGTAEIGMVTIEVVETGAVGTVNIADGAITANKILANTITADKIVGLSITGDKIAANAITADKIQALSITAAQLAANSVTATQLAAGSVTATAIQAGSIDATHIKAGAITADRLAIVGGTNMLPDPSFEGAGGAALVAGQTYWTIASTGNGSAKSVQVNAVNGSAVIRTLTLATFPILPGQQLRLATDVNPSTDWNGSSVRIYARWIDSAGGVTFGFVTNTAPAKGSWSTISGVVTAPAGTVSAEIRLATYDSSAGSVTYDNSVIQPVLGQVQIADGAITADKLDAAAINGKTITGATVQTAASGRRIKLAADGNLYLYTGASGEKAPGRVSTSTGSQVMQIIGPQVNTAIEYGLTLQDTFGSQAVDISADQVTVHGLFASDCIFTGSVTITPTAANTPTSVTVTGLGPLPGSVHRAFVTANSQVPGTVNEVTATNVTNDGLTVWISRGNTASTQVWFLIVSS
ncbi:MULTISPECIES: hypothetical protein [unclassified Streptomyces]|uniref:beta strand repeat-containing protein n=1 Tax=unclassified Streptomyces TaxID=2593676 RepID=UPI0033287009